MIDFPTSILQLIWLVIPILTLFISIRARQKQPNRGGTLMVVGSAVLAFSALGNTVLRMGMMAGSFDMDFYGTYYAISNGISLVGQILFLIGLYQFVEGARSKVSDKDLLDHLPD